jgi:hypothetical protein
MIYMKKEIIVAVLGLISVSTAMLIIASLGQDNYGINNNPMNNNSMNNTTTNLTQNATLQNLALLAQANLTIGEEIHSNNETLNETSQAITSNGTKLTTDIAIEDVFNGTTRTVIDMGINGSKDTAINAISKNATTNLTASLINGNVSTKEEYGLQSETMPTIRQHQNFMLGKGMENKKPFEIMHLTKPIIDVSKQVFISNNV